MAEPKAKTLQMKLGFFDEDLKKPMHDDILKWITNNSEDFVYNLFPQLNTWNDNKIKSIRDFCEKLIVKNISDAKKNVASNENKIQDYLQEKSQNNSDIYNDMIQSKKDNNEFLNNRILELENALDLENLPKRNPIKILDTEWEFPVTSQAKSQNGYVSQKNVIGFIDLRLKFSYTTLSVTGIDFENKKVVDKIKWKQNSRNVDLLTGHENHPNEDTLFIEVKTEIKSLGELFRQLQTYKTYVNNKFVVVCPDDKERKVIEDQGFLFVKYT